MYKHEGKVFLSSNNIEQLVNMLTPILEEEETERISSEKINQSLKEAEEKRSRAYLSKTIQGALYCVALDLLKLLNGTPAYGTTCWIGSVRIFMHTNDHPPPHFHVEYHNYESKFRIEDCAYLGGNLPKKHVKVVNKWFDGKREELQTQWDKSRPAG